jgi:D-alanyl-lipoteichoic acid acyltransferase DltB (MBOAT superfamily)
MGWFITFNFVNVAWVFFRAKDFASVEKVLGGMIGADGIVLPNGLEGKLIFLKQYGIKFGYWVSSAGLSGIKDLLFILGIFTFTVMLKNSGELIKDSKLSTKIAILTGLVLFLSLISIGAESEFLYFNF